ncbi:RNA polymerase sigma factor (sigma-70 family) [Pedobacter africanus]|uniref:RNA polymerase sigma-70 factor (ECF subfamily) n=1 Tax=Pedobacter africanus TaxID=151894 RepID=A0ACC6KW49_9SPHI|nr:sigma-70 family RNA polymerase sigma factor [Pedobacter africanus]MDR6783353.1 RNA polymerase sigma-70 factor (ECF subfamily) [Pedobacter africanus]
MRINDDLILLLLKDGNKNAYEHLFQKYYHTLRSQACMLLKDSMEAEDQVQDLFIEIMDKKLADKINSNLGAYLKTCLYHKCLVVLNKKKRRQYQIEQYRLGCDDLVYNDQLEHRESERSVYQLLRNLSVQRLNVCKLVYLEKKKYKDAAVEMGITINSVKTHLRLANKALREELEGSKSYVMNVLYA